MRNSERPDIPHQAVAADARRQVQEQEPSNAGKKEEKPSDGVGALPGLWGEIGQTRAATGNTEKSLF